MSDVNIELSDFLESYLPSTTSNFQNIISQKVEFSSLASSTNERLPKGPNQFYKHQKLTHRFLRAHPNLLVLSETGTGKTGEILGFTERVIDEVLKERKNPGTGDEKLAHFKRIIILVKGPTQENEIKNQLVCKFSRGRYETEKVKKSLTSTQQKVNVTNAVKIWYDIVTYQGFAKGVYNTRDEELIEK